MSKTWITGGDISPFDYGGTWTRHVAGRRYHVIVLDNMDEACGRDNEGQPRYVVQVREVDLDAAPVRAAAESCGPGWPVPDGTPDAALTECVSYYGAYAPLWNSSGDNGHALIRQAKRISRELSSDAGAYERAMSRPVNALGSTAREYAAGDLDSALSRKLAAGDTGARILAQMQAPIPPGPLACSIALGAIPSDDPIAYSMGFMDGFQGRPMPEPEEPEDGGGLADAYLSGREHGADVRIGRQPMPEWVR